MKKLTIILTADQLRVLVNVLEWQAHSDYGSDLLRSCALALWDRLKKKTHVEATRKVKITSWETITIARATMNYRSIRAQDMDYLSNSVTGSLLLITDQALA